MEKTRTNILLVNANGETVINDLVKTECQNCILQSTSQGSRTAVCVIDGVKRHVYVYSDTEGKLLICDDKERTTKNFLTLVDLIKHCRPSLLERYGSLKDDIWREARKEIEFFKHNIIHINSDAINEFYSFINQEYLFKNYHLLQDKISEVIRSNPDGAVELLARLAKYNLNIKTELSVVSRLNNPDSKPNYSWGNPRDAVISSVYILYPLFHKNKVHVKVDDYREKFNIDYDALQVASFYIIENATKYSKKESSINISFERVQNSLTISFSMYSLYISENERLHIFDEGFQGEQARKTDRAGKGIGLYRAKRLIQYFKGEIDVEVGHRVKTEKDGCKYSDNTFYIRLPVWRSIK